MHVAYQSHLQKIKLMLITEQAHSIMSHMINDLVIKKDQQEVHEHIILILIIDEHIYMKCDRIWENMTCSKFYEILVSCIFDKLYRKANLCTSLGKIACLAMQL